MFPSPVINSLECVLTLWFLCKIKFVLQSVFHKHLVENIVAALYISGLICVHHSGKTPLGVQPHPAAEFNHSDSGQVRLLKPSINPTKYAPSHTTHTFPQNGKHLNWVSKNFVMWDQDGGVGLQEELLPACCPVLTSGFFMFWGKQNKTCVTCRPQSWNKLDMHH